jgi:DNA-directed RNA polymerase beta subunit
MSKSKNQENDKSIDLKNNVDEYQSNIKKEKLNIGDYTIQQDDLFLVGDAEVSDKGLVYHHISSADDLYTNGIPQIITQVFKVEKEIENKRDSTSEDKEIDKIFVLIKFTDVFMSRPTMINYYSGKEEILYPNVALLEDKTYSANLRVNASITATAYLKNGSTKVRTDEIKNFKLCRVPVMVRSVLCNTHGCSKEELMRIHEDPSDPGGYFIIKGIEWVIDCIENILFNQIRIFKNEGYSKEIMRVEFVSKPGDTYQNSDYFLVRLLNDEQLTCEIVRDKFKNIQIPFYLLFRILGWSDDKSMFDNILYGYDNDISKNMFKYIVNSLNAKYNNISGGRYVFDQIDALKLIIDEMKYNEFKYLELDENPKNYQIAIKALFRIIDINFLPHIGTTSDSRPSKLRFLALIIRKLFLVRMGNMEPTDRDSYKSKRIHAAGTSYAKSFKTYFNASIIQQIKRRLIKDFRSMSFSQVDLASSVKSSVYGADFERSIMQTITSGNKSQITVNKKARTNRLSSQLLDRKNQIAVYSTLRQVTAVSSDSSKQSERANEMRRVHMSFLGYICIIHSPDGEKVGINKQLALFSSILGATSSEVIKSTLLRDKEVIQLNKVSTEMINNEQLTNVYVNGEWIGCTKDSLELCLKYRQMRRDFKIHPLTTIYWDNTQDEAYFWVDVGRVVKPLMIVYNNKRNPEKFSKTYNDKNFEQGIGVDTKILDGIKDKSIDIEYLLKNNIIEYITPEEQENCFLCPYFDQLAIDKNNELLEYTHCDIPQAILGITALTSPYANHNQTPRITFQTSQCKQTCGVFTLNWPYRCDKDTFLQYTCETPLVKTVASKYIFPNGCNVIVAIACYSGFNQEDSLVVSQGAVDRGLFNGCKFTYYKDELEQREEFGNPDVTNTTDIKSASYAKLTDGIIKVGTKVNKGDAIIGKYIRIPKSADQEMTMSDRSTIYKENEEAIVQNVIIDRNEDDERFAKIALRKVRPVTIGDKFSVIGSSQVLTDQGWMEIQNLNINEHKVATLKEGGFLDYVYPTGLSTYEYKGDMYRLQNQQLNMFVTKNHKLYVKKRDRTQYELLRTHEVFGKHVRFKKNAINSLPYQEFFTAHAEDGTPERYPMDAWLKLLGMFISDGYTKQTATGGGNRQARVAISAIKLRKKNFHIEFLNELNVRYTMGREVTYISGHQYPAIFHEMKQLSLGASNKHLPEYVWNLSQSQSQILLNSLIEGDGSYNSNGSAGYYTSSKRLANDISRLALHAGWSGTVKKRCDAGHTSTIVKNGVSRIIRSNYDSLYVGIVKTKNESQINHAHVHEQNIQIERYEPYEGKVYCLEIPDTHVHVYYSRENSFSPSAWTGNSSRAGQKGVCGITLRDSDMPFTKDGMRPSIIMNPHAIPSRMTIGQLYESLNGNWCAATGTHTDATIFKKVDIETMADELEKIGLNRYGYHRLYSGITGEFIDCMVFMGPTYYQRLQKFVIDTVYSVSQGPSDSISRQPLDGKASGGGLKIGEMERDVLCSHGSTKFLQEKFFDHSDGFTEYICRCGKAAIVNNEKGIYKCKYCKDNADIHGVPTSWSSKLFMQEMETMNVGIKRHLTPFTYESVQEETKD